MTYTVTVRTETEHIKYPAIGNLDAIYEAAYAKYKVCAVTVMVKA